MTLAFRRLALATATLAISLLAIEVGLRVSYAARDKAPPCADRALQSEWTWARRRLREGGRPLEVLCDYHPILGWTHRANLDLPGIHTNAAGMRATREFTRERVPGVPRIAFVGDSYVFGFNVRDDEAFPARLARGALDGWEVLNFGVIGYGVDQSVLFDEQIASAFQPDILVLGIFPDDALRDLRRFRGYRKPRFELDDSGKLHLTNLPIRPPEILLDDYRAGRRVIGGFGMSYLAAKIAMHLRKATELRPVKEDAEAPRLLAALLERFHDRAVADRVKPFVLVFPSRPEVRDGTIFEQIEDWAARDATRLGMPVLSLHDAFTRESRVHPDVALFQDEDAGGHLTPRGNELVAAELAASLTRQGWLAPSTRQAGPGQGHRHR